ncbi:MFS transporter [Lactiplantibacillus pentosus]|uniref:MFS transporter n=1 Tax=Lactiplantibacillus pentosus TaxID=1589 RepID=UPI003C214BFC
MHNIFAKYLNKSVFYYLSGTFINNIGNGIFTLITSKIIYDQTNSVAMIGLIIIIQNVIASSFNLIAGHIADQLSAKKISMIADIVQGAAVLISLLLINTRFRLAALLTTMILINLALPFFRAANFKNVAEIKRGSLELSSLNAIRSSLNQGGQLIGVALATPFIYYSWYESALLINMITFFISACCTARIEVVIANDVEATVQTVNDNLIKDWIVFIGFLKRNWVILVVLIFTIFDYLAVNVVNLMEIKYSTKVLHNVAWMGMMDGFFAVGSMLSFLIVGRLSQRWNFNVLIWLGLFVQGIGFIILSQTSSVWLTMAMMWLIGLFNGTSITFFQTSLQLNLDTKIHGKISSFRDILVSLSTIVLIPLFSKAIDYSVLQGLLLLGMVLIGVTVVLVIVAQGAKFKQLKINGR